MKKSIAAVVTALLISTTTPAWAHGDAPHAPAAKKPMSTEEKTFGREGDPKSATRSIAVDMSDRMRFSPDTIAVQRGETVRFIVKNSGKIMHEFVLGSMDELKAHSDMMTKHPGMEHDAPYMAHVAPGKTAAITWQFTKTGNFSFGCLIPGHFEAGMIGKVTVN